jgi:predicted acylesterase/phospholipase RssA
VAKAHLKLSDIQYLALEGGGGKGFAYLGALQLLESNKAQTGLRNDINVLNQIKGVAGTSAGAITAFMIALGMGSKDIAQEIAHPTKLNSYDDFFDPSRPRYIPAPSKYTIRSDNPLETALLALGNAIDANTLYDKYLRLLKAEGKMIQDYFSGLLSSMGGIGGFYWANYLANAETSFIQTLTKAKPLVNVLFLDPAYRVYAIRDMGFFSGFVARQYFDNLIATRYANAFGGRPYQYQNLTFEAHHKVTQKLQNIQQLAGQKGASVPRFKDLMVAGANLSTGKSQLFSYVHTPKFPIADAVRLSMSLPLIYKPYVISKKTHGGPPCGTYIDGGWWNNLPFRDVNPKKTTANTLSLRLTIDVPKMICTVFDLEKALLANLMGSGESQATAEFASNMIVLDTDGLSLLDFNPPSKVQDLVTHRSRRIVCRYFGWKNIDPADANPADDQRMAADGQVTACGTCESDTNTTMGVS